MQFNRKEVTRVLNDFYHRPVAMVSLELFLSVIAVVFFAVFAIRPTLLTMAELVKEIEDKRKLDQALQQKIAALATSQSSYLSLQERLVVLDEAIPNSPHFIDSLKMLERLASDRGLIITSVVINEIPPETEIEVTDKSERITIPISVTVTGNYTNIRDFIGDVLELRRAFIIDSVVFSKSDERGQERLDANITFGLPYFGENSPSANDQKPVARPKNQPDPTLE